VRSKFPYGGIEMWILFVSIIIIIINTKYKQLLIVGYTYLTQAVLYD